MAPKTRRKQYYGKGIPGIDLSRLTGRLIVIEGPDGSGRSTQIAMLSDWLERLGFPTATIGLKRSDLVSDELELAMTGNTLSPITMGLFYATDFCDQLEHRIIPALRAGFVVLADRYIYTLMARDIVRGVSVDWVKNVYGIAIEPDAVFYLRVAPEILAQRNFHKDGRLDYWESGMDIQRTGDMYQCFIRYQRRIQRVFRRMQDDYGFETIDGNRRPSVISSELTKKIKAILDHK